MFRTIGKSVGKAFDYIRKSWSQLETYLFDMGSNGDYQWKTRSMAELERMRHSVVYPCVRQIYQSANQAPLQIIKRTSANQWELVDNHPFNNLLTMPNDLMSWAEFEAHYISHLMLTGYSYVWKWRNGMRGMAQLWPVPSSWVKPCWKSGMVAYYELTVPGEAMIKIALEDMAMQLLPDPSHPCRGLSPLASAIREVEMDEERQDYLIELLANTSHPGLVLTRSTPFTNKEENDEIKAQLLDNIGPGRRGNVLLLGGADAKLNTQTPMSDMDWPGLTGLNETRICANFGVPPILIGLRSGLENATYSNYGHAKKSFYEATMIPNLNAMDTALSRGLLWAEGEDRKLELYHDTSVVAELQEDQNDRAKRAGELFQRSLCSMDEARQIVGLDPLEKGGDLFAIPNTMMLVPQAELIEMQSPVDPNSLRILETETEDDDDDDDAEEDEVEEAA